MAAVESTTHDLVELSRRSVGRSNRSDFAARGLMLGEVRSERFDRLPGAADPARLITIRRARPSAPER
jgi:hypothetical protein